MSIEHAARIIGNYTGKDNPDKHSELCSALDMVVAEAVAQAQPDPDAQHCCECTALRNERQDLLDAFAAVIISRALFNPVFYALRWQPPYLTTGWWIIDTERCPVTGPPEVLDLMQWSEPMWLDDAEAEPLPAFYRGFRPGDALERYHKEAEARPVQIVAEDRLCREVEDRLCREVYVGSHTTMEFGTYNLDALEALGAHSFRIAEPRWQRKMLVPWAEEQWTCLGAPLVLYDAAGVHYAALMSLHRPGVWYVQP